VNKFKIKIVKGTPLRHVAEYGSLTFDSRIWNDEFILNTDRTLEELKDLTFIISIENVNQ
jgi:hypothetical protein